MKKMQKSPYVDLSEAVNQIVGEYSPQTGLCEAVGQAIENALDANATFVKIVIDEEKDLFLIVNDGPGFQERDLDGFLALLKSYKKGDKIGKWGTGRTFLFRLSEEVIVWSKSKDYSGGLKLGLTRPLIAKFFDRDFKADYFVDIQLPDFFPFKDKNTGTVIQLKGVDWKKLRGRHGKIEPDTRLRRELAAYLNHEDAKCVTVNGKGLEAPDAIATLVLNETHPKYGSIRVHLWMPKSSARVPQGYDQVKIGGRNPLLSMAEYGRKVSGEHASAIPLVLLNGAVIGNINVSSFNKFRSHASHGEKALNEAFFESDEQRWFNDEFLSRTLTAKIEEVFGGVQQQLDEVEARLELADLVRDWNVVTVGEEEVDKKRKKRKPVNVQGPAIRVSPPSAVLDPGEEITFTIGEPGEYEWDDGDSGGKCHPKKGPKVTFTAGKTEMKGVLKVFKSGKPQTETGVSITISKDRTLKIVPDGVSIPRGGKDTFHLRGRDKHKQVEWNISTRSREIELIPDEKNGIADVRAGTLAPIGEYEIFAQYKGEPDTMVSATFRVTEGEEEELLGLDEQLYRVQPSVMQVELIRLAQGTSPHPNEPDTRIGEITVLTTHEEVKPLSDLTTAEARTISRKLMFMDAIINYHIEAEIRAGRLDHSGWLTRFHELRAPFVKSMKKKKK